MSRFYWVEIWPKSQKMFEYGKTRVAECIPRSKDHRGTALEYIVNRVLIQADSPTKAAETAYKKYSEYEIVSMREQLTDEILLYKKTLGK